MVICVLLHQYGDLCAAAAVATLSQESLKWISADASRIGLGGSHTHTHTHTGLGGCSIIDVVVEAIFSFGFIGRSDLFLLKKIGL